MRLGYSDRLARGTVGSHNNRPYCSSERYFIIVVQFTKLGVDVFEPVATQYGGFIQDLYTRTLYILYILSSTFASRHPDLMRETESGCRGTSWPWSWAKFLCAVAPQGRRVGTTPVMYGAMLRSLFYLLKLQEIYCFKQVRLTSYQYHPDRRRKNIVVGFGTGWRLTVSYWLLVSGNVVWGK